MGDDNKKNDPPIEDAAEAFEMDAPVESIAFDDEPEIMEIGDAEPMEIEAEPLEIADAEPMEIEAEPLEIADAEPVEMADMEPMEVADAEPMEIEAEAAQPDDIEVEIDSDDIDAVQPDQAIPSVEMDEEFTIDEPGEETGQPEPASTNDLMDVDIQPIDEEPTPPPAEAEPEEEAEMDFDVVEMSNVAQPTSIKMEAPPVVEEIPPEPAPEPEPAKTVAPPPPPPDPEPDGDAPDLSEMSPKALDAYMVEQKAAGKSKLDIFKLYAEAGLPRVDALEKAQQLFTAPDEEKKAAPPPAPAADIPIAKDPPKEAAVLFQGEEPPVEKSDADSKPSAKRAESPKKEKAPRPEAADEPGGADIVIVTLMTLGVALGGAAMMGMASAKLNSALIAAPLAVGALAGLAAFFQNRIAAGLKPQSIAAVATLVGSLFYNYLSFIQSHRLSSFNLTLDSAQAQRPPGLEDLTYLSLDSVALFFGNLGSVFNGISLAFLISGIFLAFVIPTRSS